MISLTHELIADRWKVPLVAAFTCLAASMLLAAAKVALQSGFGGSDLFPFFFWTVPFSVLIALVSSGLGVLLLRVRSIALTTIVRCILGAVVGALWTLLMVSWFGYYFAAFSFEAVTCWIVGGISGSIISWKDDDRPVRSFAIPIVIILPIWLGGLVGDRPLLRLLTDSQQIEVVAVKWTPGPDSLSNPPILGMKLADADLERLKLIGLTGQVEFASSGVFGEGKQAKTIIVISQQLKHPTTLAQPDGGVVVYVQTPEGWKTYPSNAATLGRNIQLSPDKREPERVTRYLVENADGSRQGGTLVTW